MTRDEYARRWSTASPRLAEVKNTQCIPDDVVRVMISAPCPFCGVSRGLCKHRVAA